MKVKFTMPKDSGLKADFNINKSNTIALKSELNAEIEARIEGDNNLQSEITRVENEIPDISGLATKTELQEVENEIPDISNLATKTELQEVEESIPIVNNGTLTIIQNDETKGVFRANDSNDVTINLEAGGGGGAVDSVNGQTGDVVLTASDVGALPNTTVIPTKTSDLINNSGFITNAVNNLTNYYLKSDTYTKLEVQQLITSIPKFTVVVVQALPVTGQSMTLYLLPKDGEAPDVYEEYIWVTETETYELIGSTAVDLDGYATEDWVEAKGYATETFVNDGLATKQDVLTAGTDLEIVTSSGGDNTVSGTTSIALNGASANGLNSVTLTGACEQRDILPSEYQRVEYLQSSGTQYIDTGYKLSSTDEVKIKAKFVAFPGSAGSSYIFGIYGNNANFGINNDNTNNYVVWGSSSTKFTPFMETGTTYNVDMKLGLLTINGITASYTPSGTFTNTTKNAYLFWANGTSQIKKPVAIYSFQIINNGTIVQNLIPCRRNSDNVLGMYDTVTGTFLTNAGTGTFTAGADVTTPSPDNVMPIWCNNGVLKVSPNLFDKSDNSQYINAYVNNSTGVLTEYSLGYCFCIPCKPNTTYTLSGMTSNSTWGSFTSNSIGTTATAKASNNGSLTTGANDKYLIGIAYTTAMTPIDYRDTLQLELGSTATSYMPYGQVYTDGTVETVTDSNQSTATAEMLLSVGNYKDTQSILNGAITRNVGIRVLDGSEEWNAITNNRGYYLMINCVQDAYTKVYGICSHFNFYVWADNTTPMPDNNFGFNKSASSGITNGNITFKPNLTDIPTVEDWKAFLANEYANGTPVIVVYPLATPTTETVTGQTLITIAGNNTLTITQASIENLPIEANYDLIGGIIINFTNASGYQRTSNLVTSVSSLSTDSQYPSAKLFYNTCGDIETAINTIRGV